MVWTRAGARRFGQYFWSWTSEADVSTLQARAQASSWLPRPHGHRRRPQSAERPPRPRPQAPVGLSLTSRPDAAAPAPRARVDKLTGGLRWLVRRADFQAAAKGRRAHAPSFTLQARARVVGETETDAPRFGLTATRKTGDSVERNRMKRRLRAALRGLDAFGRPGHDYVVVLRREALSTPFETLLADLKKTMRKAHEARSRAAGEPTSGAPPKSRSAPSAGEAIS